MVTAIPTVVSSLGGLELYSWVYSVYFLAATVTVPLWGRLSDIYGRRVFYLAGIGLFVVGSALCGLSQSMVQLVAFRVIQGLGAGALLPLGMTIIGDIYSLERRAKVQAWFSGVWGISSIIGPLVGGMVTDYLSWRWVFYLNVPFGLFGACIIAVALQEPERSQRGRIDYLGAVLLIVSMSLLLLGLDQRGDGETAWLQLCPVNHGSSSCGAVHFSAEQGQGSHPATESFWGSDLFRCGREWFFQRDHSLWNHLLSSAFRSGCTGDRRDRSGMGHHPADAGLDHFLDYRGTAAADRGISSPGRHRNGGADGRSFFPEPSGCSRFHSAFDPGAGFDRSGNGLWCDCHADCRSKSISTPIPGNRHLSHPVLSHHWGRHWCGHHGIGDGQTDGLEDVGPRLLGTAGAD